MDRVPPGIFVIFLGIWLALLIAGKYQYARIKRSTLSMALSQLEEARKTHLALSIEDYYAFLLPRWEQMVRQNALFIPHSTEMWPVRATPEFAKKRLKFTPEWLGAYLTLEGQALPAAPALQEQIDAIVRLAPPAQR